ncbi:SRPBCC family protein [Aquimarina sediminis]|uniref:SRPBCC family protein n=1 Tax=Aquimarina sediminis TaxID=2070536 RepID=UPI000CA02D36|nr:SRPBCC domain-containing protein [Aquimarina sediminis]
MKSTDDPIIVEQIFLSSVQKVWNAITKPEEMKKWYFEALESFVPQVGFKTEFSVQVEDRKFTHLWQITEAIPEKKITYNWKYKEYPGNSFVTFELKEEKNKIKLELTTKIVESFPDDIPEFTRESCLAGWDYFIRKNLKEYIESN